MQPTNPQDDQPQGVPIEPYRGPLIARMEAEQLTRRARVREIEQTNIYWASQLTSSLESPPRSRMSLRRLGQILYHSNDLELEGVKRCLVWLLGCCAIMTIVIITNSSFQSAWTGLVTLIVPVALIVFVLLLYNLSHLRQSRSIGALLWLLFVTLIICLVLLLLINRGAELFQIYDG